MPLNIRKRTWFLAAAMALFVGAAVYTAAHARHIMFLLGPARSKVRRIEVPPFQPVPVPADWARCRFGSWTFRCPPEMKDVTKPGKGRILRLSGDGRDIMVWLPSDTRVKSEIGDGLLQDLGVGDLSLGQIRAGTYAADPRDFRWSMTGTEVRHLAGLIRVKEMVVDPGVRIESLNRGEVKGFLTLGDGFIPASFELLNDRRHATGAINFFDESATRGDLTWARAVLSSLEWSGEIYPESTDAGKVERVIEPAGADASSKRR